MEPVDFVTQPLITKKRVLWLSVTLIFAALLGLVLFLMTDKKETEISWLYSQTAESAEMVSLGGNKYELTLIDVDIHTIMFSDRPDRIVDIVATQQIIDGWDIAFAESAPNAVLVEHEPTGETDSLVVVLYSPEYDSMTSTLTYQVELLADEQHPDRLKQIANAHDVPPLEFKVVSLFIDNVTAPGAMSVLSGPGASALAEKLGIPADVTDPISLGGGIKIAAANIVQGDDGGLSGQSQIAIGSNGLLLNMDVNFVDAQNWSMTISELAGNVWSPPSIPGLSIDPETLEGSVAMTNGVLEWNLVGETHTWSMSPGATFVSALSFSSSCPVPAEQCPTNENGAFIGMKGTATITDFPNPIEIQGGLALDGTWARFDGSAGDLMVEGTGITNSTLTIWRGDRNDSFDADMKLPDLGTLAGGNNFEFCGGFTLSVPKVSNLSTTGCARWTPAGVVMAQSGNGSGVNGSMASTGSDGSSSAEIMGFAWTNISTESLAQLPSSEVSFSNVANALQTQTITLSGKASLPGTAAAALGIDLKGAKSLVFEVRGTASSSEFSLAGEIKVNIVVGSEPMKINVQSIGASITATTSGSFSFTVATSGQATVGYAPQSRDIATSLTLEAAVAPQLGMMLSINARGVPSAVDASRDGLTPTSRLTKPEAATYVWPNQFGIKGMNLWNLTIQVGFIDGSPSLAYSSTTYLDPNGAQTKNALKCDGPCDSSDWMTSQLAINVSYTNPCFAYSFTSNSGKSYLAIDGGVLKASTFQVGVAPAGCSINSGGTIQSLPVGFVGFQFTATFGDDPTTINVATALSVEGFVFVASLDKLNLAGMRYSNLSFSVKITESLSEVKFSGKMDSKMGDASVLADFAVNSTGLKQTLDLNLINWSWAKKGTMDLKKFHFKTSADIPSSGGCAQFSSQADGLLTMGTIDYTLNNAEITVNCNGIVLLDLDVQFQHTAKWNGATTRETLTLHYPHSDFMGKKYFKGEASIEYSRHLSKKAGGRTFSADVKVGIDFQVKVYPSKPSDSRFEVSGYFEAGRVSGDFDCVMDGKNNDFGCEGDVRYNPSWAGVYREHWGGL